MNRSKERRCLVQQGDTLEVRIIDNQIKLLLDIFNRPVIHGLDLSDLENNIRNTLAHITERESKIIALRYCLDNTERLTYTKIAEIFDVTSERIRQIEKRGLKNMRNEKISKELFKKDHFINIHVLGDNSIEQLFIDDLYNLFQNKETVVIETVFERNNLSFEFETQVRPKLIGQGEQDTLAVSMNYIDVPIDELNLSSRTFNCVTHAGLKTVGDILRMSEKELQRIRNLGKKSYDELIYSTKNIKTVYNDAGVNQESYFFTTATIKFTDNGTEHTYQMVSEGTHCQIPPLVNYLYSLICDRENKGPNIFDVLLSSKLKNYLLLKGYFYLSDIVHDMSVLEIEFDAINIPDLSDELKNFINELSSTIAIVKDEVFDMFSKYNISSIHQLEELSSKDMSASEKRRLSSIKKWCEDNILYSIGGIDKMPNSSDQEIFD